MDVANRLVHEIHRRFLAGRRDQWLSGVLLTLTSAVGTAVAIETLYEFRSGLWLLSLTAGLTGILAGGLRMLLRRLDGRSAEDLSPVETWRVVTGCRFAEGNLIVAAALLTIVSGLMFVFGSSLPVLASLAGAVASASVLVLGSLPGTPLNALVLCTSPISRRSRSFEQWPGELLLFERQRRARLDDSASDRPRLEEFRDALDAERAGLDPRDIRPPAGRTLAEELPRRLCALLWPGGIATAVAAVVLLLLAPPDWSLAGQPPEPPSQQPDSPSDDSPSNPPEDPSAQTNSPNNADSQASNQTNESGGGTGKDNGRGGSNQQGGGRGGANGNPGPGSSSTGKGKGLTQKPNGNGSSNGGGNNSKPGNASDSSSSKRDRAPGSRPGSSPASKPQADSPDGSGKLPAGGPKKGESQVGPAKTPRADLGQGSNTPTRNQNGMKKPGGSGAGTSGGANGKPNSKPDPRRNATPASPPPPGQGPVTHIRFSGGTQVDGRLLDLPQGAGNGKASDAETLRRSTAPEPVRLPTDSRPVQIPAFPLRKR